MQNLSEVLEKLKKQYPHLENSQSVHTIEMLKQDQDIQDFWQANQDKLAPDAFSQSLTALYEYVQQRNMAAQNSKTLYPGYVPQLDIEKGYIHVKYVPTQQTQNKLRQKEHLNTYKMPVAIQQADLAAVVQESGRIDAIVEAINILDNLTHAKNYVQGLYLYGDFGVGKTYLMGALANALAANNIDVMLLHFPSFAVDVKNSIGRKDSSTQRLIDQAKNATILILDDMGADTLSAWIRDDILGVILEHRMQNELTTFFTSNFSMKGLEEHLTQTRDGVEPVKAARLMQRVRFLAKPIPMSGKNRRLES
ncbi:MAG: primosomal protein DnaI [Leuconostoc fallax]